MKEFRMISREQFLSRVLSNIECRSQSDLFKRRRGSFRSYGNWYRLKVAKALYSRVWSGGVATTKEVVGYFGAGARCGWSKEVGGG